MSVAHLLRDTGLRVAALLLMAALCGGLWNALGPRPVPWFENWDQHVESLAFKANMPLIRLKEMQAVVTSGSHLIFDARPEEDYEAGHLPGAMNLPYLELHDRLDEVLMLVTPETPIVGYCSGSHCDDALLMLLELRELGITNSVLFAEGFDIWRRTNHPVESYL